MLTVLLTGNSGLVVRFTNFSMSIGAFVLKTDQQAVSEHILPWLRTPKYMPKMTLVNVSVQSAHSLSNPLLKLGSWVIYMEQDGLRGK